MRTPDSIVIVGAGPVGLLLACLLAQRGVRVQVLDQRHAAADHSRAIGIHPPGLECLAEAGVADALIARGVRVNRGVVYSRGQRLGHVSFDRLASRFPFVLCAPQRETDDVLERRLYALDPQALRRGHEVVACATHEHHAALDVRTQDGSYTLESPLVVGCDGARSFIAQATDIASTGSRATSSFAMSDVADDTDFGHDAMIFLSGEPVVESFPLPNGQRRWVVGLGDGELVDDNDAAAVVERLVSRRTGHSARADTATTASAFTPAQRLAERFVSGPYVLAGDAAHVISPIGGQGMNLGWLDARLIATLVDSGTLDTYSHIRRKAARRAMRRASFFTVIGHPWPVPLAREWLVRGLLSPPLRGRTARVVTMAGLG